MAALPHEIEGEAFLNLFLWMKHQNIPWFEFAIILFSFNLAVRAAWILGVPYGVCL